MSSHVHVLCIHVHMMVLNWYGIIIAQVSMCTGNCKLSVIIKIETDQSNGRCPCDTCTCTYALCS